MEISKWDNTADLLLTLKSDNPDSDNVCVSGSIDIQHLCKDLLIDKLGHFKHPMAFAQTLLSMKHPYDLVESLKAGLRYHKLKHFPRLSFYDSSRNPHIGWTGVPLQKIAYDSTGPDQEAIIITGRIIAVLKKLI